MTPALIAIIYISPLDDLSYTLKIAQQPFYQSFDQPRDPDRYAVWRAMVLERYNRALRYLLVVPALISLISEKALAWIFLTHHKRHLHKSHAVRIFASSSFSFFQYFYATVIL